MISFQKSHEKRKGYLRIIKIELELAIRLDKWEMWNILG